MSISKFIAMAREDGLFDALDFTIRVERDRHQSFNQACKILNPAIGCHTSMGGYNGNVIEASIVGKKYIARYVDRLQVSFDDKR